MKDKRLLDKRLKTYKIECEKSRIPNFPSL